MSTDRTFTVLEILGQSTEYLEKQGIESSRLQAELLLAHVLGKSRLDLYLCFDHVMLDGHLDMLRPLLKRRGKGEPLQHIIGETEFCDLKLRCSPLALVPRPETELLVEIAANCFRNEIPGVIYDVGTGSGAIALALAHYLPGWEIVGIDIDSKALDLAKQNHGLYSNLHVSWHCSSLLEEQTRKARAVVANLPYLTKDEMGALPMEVQADPPQALDGGKDGLEIIERLLPQAKKLAEWLFLEIAPHQTKKMCELMEQHGFKELCLHKDLTGRERFITGRSSEMMLAKET